MSYVDCGECPRISTGCEAGRCLKAEPAADQGVPAVFTMHTAQGPVYCCVRHARQVEAVMRALGMRVPASAAPAGTECSNCANAAKAAAPRPGDVS